MITELQILGQIVLALVLGALLGWNRERGGKPAGLRTYALVSAGSALFTVMSAQAFGGNEPTRIAAQIVSGIGFIGAGAILHRGDHVEGVTTAAGLWMVAAIGMAVGAEFYLLSILSTLLIGAVLFINDKKVVNKQHSVILKEQNLVNPESEKQDNPTPPSPPLI